MEIKIGNPCAEKKTLHCVNCHNHFRMIKPSLKSVVVSRHFIRDLKDEKERNSIIKEVLDCSDLEFTELHKFEENIDGSLVFRAKKEGLHIVYCVDKNMRIIFLRAFRSYSEYRRFLEDKKEIKRMIVHLYCQERLLLWSTLLDRPSYMDYYVLYVAASFVNTSTSTVGLPRESRISLTLIFIVLGKIPLNQRSRAVRGRRRYRRSSETAS